MNVTLSVFWLLGGKQVACTIIKAREPFRTRPDFQEHCTNLMLGITKFFLLKKRS